MGPGSDVVVVDMVVAGCVAAITPLHDNGAQKCL